MSAADKLLEALAEKVDALNEARAKVATLQAELAQAAARLILETGGEVPPLPGVAAPAPPATAPTAPLAPAPDAARQAPAPPAPERPRPTRTKASGRKPPRRRARRAAPPPSSPQPAGVEPARSALFGGPPPRRRPGGRVAGIPTLREAVLALLRRQGPTKGGEIVRALGRNARSVERTLRKLITDRALVRNDGPGEEPVYALPDGVD
ncbi:MAG TPA: hypothetical protein VFS43_40705 [Polyangiaceae bacterium]|nr:hypothetical protein [Polyangiaceae bacterium]